MQLSIETHRFYIDGRWVDPVGRATFDLINPATEEPLATVALAATADVDLAVDAAARAFPRFSSTPVPQRIAFLKAIITSLEARAEEMAQLVTAEIGSPIAFSRAFHVAGAIAQIAGMIETARSYEFERRISGALIVREAIGVCGLIVPWNAPLALLAGKVATAIAAGCTMVVKPSELSASSTLAFANAVHDAGLPPGVFNLINGDGAVAGQHLAAHPRVDMVSITGSTRAGRLVAVAAAESVKRVHQELGGKSANLILRDANIDQVVPAGVARCFVGSGQSCQAPTRMLVHRSQHARALELAAVTANGFKLGDPCATETTMGPVVSKPQFDRVQSLIQSGVDEDAVLASGGLGRPDHLSKGYFVRPTVFGDVKPTYRIAREEIFGPVLSILPYESEEEAIAMANDSDYGLAGWVWSADVDRARQVARSLRTGRVYINGAPPVAAAPLGGIACRAMAGRMARWDSRNTSKPRLCWDTDRMSQAPQMGMAAALASAFGDIAAMSQLYDDDIAWSLPASFGPLAGPHRGRDAVVAFNELVNTAYDPATVEVEILDDLSQGDVSVARFIYRARMLPSSEQYEGEYALFVRSRQGRIIAVQERLDTLAVYRIRKAMGQADLFE